MMTPPQTFGSAVATITWELLAPPKPESVMDMDSVPQLGNQVPLYQALPKVFRHRHRKEERQQSLMTGTGSTQPSATMTQPRALSLAVWHHLSERV